MKKSSTTEVIVNSFLLQNYKVAILTALSVHLDVITTCKFIVMCNTLPAVVDSSPQKAAIHINHSLLSCILLSTVADGNCNVTFHV